MPARREAIRRLGGPSFVVGDRVTYNDINGKPLTGYIVLLFVPKDGDATAYISFKNDGLTNELVLVKRLVLLTDQGGRP